jgi:hypothetical protein
MFSLYASLFSLMALMIVPGSLFSLILFSKLVLLMACTRESVPFAFCSASLSCLWLVQGSLFPLLSVQQACLAFDLVKGLCSLSLYCWSPAHFWSIIFLHLIKKKNKHLDCYCPTVAVLFLNRYCPTSPQIFNYILSYRTLFQARLAALES